MNETVNDSVIGNSNKKNALGNETLQLQAYGRYNNAERTFNDENSACENSSRREQYWRKI